jgi:hypothetical protein
MAELARSLTAEREERELKEKEVTELKRDPFVNGPFFK